MRGFPYNGGGTIAQKQASLGHSNRWLKCDTAVNGESTPILLIGKAEFRNSDGDPTSLSPAYDGRLYTWTRYDALTNRHVYTLSPSPAPSLVPADVAEGQERVDVIGTVGRVSRGPTLAELKNTEAGWPLGGDRGEPIPLAD